MFIATVSSVRAQDGEFMSNEQKKLVTTFINAEKERQLGNLQESVILFNQCLDLDPSHDASYFGLGKIYLEQKMYPDAERNFEQAVELDKQNKWYWLSWAQVMLAREKYKEATKVYKEMVDRYPDDPQLRLDYANTLLYAGKERKAMKVFDAFEETAGPTEEVARRKYQYYVKREQFDKAAEEIEKLIEAFPGDNQLYGMLADLYKVQGDIDRAIEVYEKARKADPGNPYIQLSLSEFYESKGQNDTAYHYLKEAYRNRNLDIDTKVGVLLKMYPQAERFPKVREQAIELSELVVATHPDQAKSYSVLGDFLFLDGRSVAARRQYKKATAIDPSRFAIWNQILYIDSEQGDFDSLLLDSKGAMDLFPAQPTIYFFHGLALIQKANYKEAADVLKSGSQLVIGNNALSAQMLASLGDAYYELGRNASSDSAYNAALSYQPNNAYVLNNYSYFLSLRNERLEEAKAMSARSLELEPSNPSYLDTYGWILYQLGNYEEAELFLSRALEEGAKSSPEVLEHYGDALFKLGRKEEAMEQWKLAKGFSNSPNEPLNQKIETGELND